MLKKFFKHFFIAQVLEAFYVFWFCMRNGFTEIRFSKSMKFHKLGAKEFLFWTLLSSAMTKIANSAQPNQTNAYKLVQIMLTLIVSAQRYSKPNSE